MKYFLIILYLLAPIIYITPSQLPNLKAVSIEKTTYPVDKYLGRNYCVFWVQGDGKLERIQVKTRYIECKDFVTKYGD